MPFEVGHDYIKPKVMIKGGRPKGSKNLLPLIRDKVLYALDKRISGKKALKNIPTEDLLRFAQSIMPKDLSIRVTPNIQYISHTPRPIDTIECKPELKQVVYNNDSPNSTQSVTSDVIDIANGDEDE